MISKSTRTRSGAPEDARGLIQRHLAAATIEVFRDYRVEARGGQPESIAPTTEDVVVTIVGFTGDKMHGSLVLTASETSVNRWRAPFGAEDGTTDPCDILGELANMVLGRLKSKLLPDGLLIRMSTPTTTRGHAVLRGGTAEPAERLTFGGDGWRLSARVDAELDDGFRLQEAPADIAVEAGDIMLF